MSVFAWFIAAANAGSAFWLRRNQRKKKALADTKGQYGRVADENRTLLEQLEATQKENYAVTEHLRKELLAKTQHIAELQAKNEQVRLWRILLCLNLSWSIRKMLRCMILSAIQPSFSIGLHLSILRGAAMNYQPLA